MLHDYTADFIARFWSKINRTDDPDQCWEWQAYRCKQGYGDVGWRGKMEKAHRVAYSIANGIDPGAMKVCHSCDNPPCCNPNHLFLGTQADNNHDREQKGRGNQPSGEKHGRAKLSYEQVADIRRQYAEGGTSLKKLGREYNVSYAHIHRIVHRKLWK